MITGFARFDGWPVAIMASDPRHYGGCWTADVCEKVIRFCDMAEIFHLPVVHMVDCPGFLVGLQAEQEGTIRYGSRALTAVFQATMPWCTLIVRKVFGVAGSAHQNATRYNVRYCWPS